VGFADTGVRGDNASSTITVRNNVWQANTYGPTFQSVQVQDHNILNAGGVSFVDAGAGDFHLAQATAAGVALSAPYNLDPDGNVRGADGTWDLGAFEFRANSNPPSPPTDLTPPTAPSNVRVQ
jgi:hypothetical protein